MGQQETLDVKGVCDTNSSLDSSRRCLYGGSASYRHTGMSSSSQFAGGWLFFDESCELH